MAGSGAGPVLGSHAASLPGPTFRAALNEGSRLPAGFPPALDSPLAWSGYHFAGQANYVLKLDEPAVAEVENALEQFKGGAPGSSHDGCLLTGLGALGLDGDLISRENFPLPGLGPRLDQLRREIYQGRGFGLIRGLRPQRYSVEDLTMLHLGIQSYLANRPGRQDSKGNMLGGSSSPPTGTASR